MGKATKSKRVYYYQKEIDEKLANQKSGTLPWYRTMALRFQEGFDLVSGWKKKRYDNAFTKNFPSKLYNLINRKISGIKLHDMNCGLKAYKNKVVITIEVYGEMHRFIPVIAKAAGFDKIGEKIVQHQSRPISCL